VSVVATVLRAARPNFLILTPVCLFMALAAAWSAGFRPDAVLIALVLVAGLLAHAAVNWLNEWEDFRSGLDLATERTPFSGGSGALPAVPAASTAVLTAGVVGLSVVALIGLYLVAHVGTGLLVPGLVGMGLVVAYTTWITRRALLCLVAPGLGFGPIMIAGTYYALTGHYSPTIVLASLTPMFLISGLLLINQFPDLEPDRQHGRHHLPILQGRKAAAHVFLGLMILAYLTPVIGVIIGMLPTMTLLVLVPVPAALLVARRAIRHADEPEKLVPWLGLNVATLMMTIILLGVGLLS
jgi:1,4-dihydroxy-2-naphthoate polyprenyltransferase